MMPSNKPIVFDGYPPNSAPGLHCRLGVPTASMLMTVLARGKGGVESQRREELARKLAYELISGEPTNERPMVDDSAIAVYLEKRDGVDPVAVSRPAFVRRDDLHVGCAPAALIGNDGGVSIEPMVGWEFLRLARDPSIPPEYKAEVQGSLWITGRKWWDVAFICRGQSPIIMRELPDQSYHQDLARQVRDFNTVVGRWVEEHTKETLFTHRRRLEERQAALEDQYFKSQNAAPVKK